MSSNLPNDTTLYSLMTVIVHRSLGQRVVQYAKSLGLKRFTSFHGRGTVPNAILKFLEMDDVHKDVLLFIMPTGKVGEITHQMKDKFHFDKPGRGILFTVKLSHVLGITHKASRDTSEEPNRSSDIVAVCTIVDKGQGEEVFRAANGDSSHGGTIIEAHGSTDQSQHLFNLRVETEKEMVLMLVPAASASGLAASIREKLELEKRNTGILFTYAVDSVLGLNSVSPGQADRLEEGPSGAGHSRFDAIWAIVPAGNDERVIRSAERGGSQGGTILHARGAHIREHSRLIASIEPTREVVVVISKREDTPSICRTIHDEMCLDDPGQGILFVFPLLEVTGVRP